MNIPGERRSGRDRRTSFLNSLDRRQGPGQRRNPQCDASTTAPDRAQESSVHPGRVESDWGAGEDVPPFE